MDTRILLPGLVAVVLVTPSLAEGIYKWTDEDGVPHYSDTPREGAEEVQIQPVQTFSAPETPVASAESEDETVEEADELVYESLAISSPNQEETIWNTGGRVSVSINLRPALRMEHRMRMFYDGQLLGDLPPGATVAELSDVVRGTHTLRAEVTDQSGRILIQSQEITFFYQQTAVNRRPGIR